MFIEKLDIIEENVLKPYIAKTVKKLVINKIKNNKKYVAYSLDVMNEENDFGIEDLNSNVENIMFSNEKMKLVKKI